MQLYGLLCSLALVSTAAAAPPALSPRSPTPKSECSAVVLIVDLLHLYEATPFCSSFLGIPTSTSVIKVSTTTTEVSTTSTAVSTATVVTTTNVDTITTSVITSTTTDYVATTTLVDSTSVTSTETTTTTATTTLGALEKRNSDHYGRQAKRAPHVSIPAYLTSFASAELSTACSCLSVPTTVVKSTTSVTISVSSTETVSYTATVSTETFTSTTETINVLDIITSTTATTTTTTYSDVVTTTVVTEAIVTPATGPSFYLSVSGLDNVLDNGYFQYWYSYAISNEGYTPGTGATAFVLDASGQLFTSGFGYVAGTFSGETSQNIYFTPPTGGYPSGFEPLTCSTSDQLLSCSSNNGGGDTLFVNTGEDQIVGYLSIGSSAEAAYPINVDPA